MLLTLAHLTATTVPIGLLVAYSLALARGSTDRGGWGAGVGLMDGTVVRGLAIPGGIEPGADTGL